MGQEESLPGVDGVFDDSSSDYDMSDDFAGSSFSDENVGDYDNSSYNSSNTDSSVGFDDFSGSFFDEEGSLSDGADFDDSSGFGGYSSGAGYSDGFDLDRQSDDSGEEQAPTLEALASYQGDSAFGNSQNNQLKGGLVKCAKCGSSDIKFSQVTHMLVCQDCRNSWSESKLEDDQDIKQLKGKIVYEGASKIEETSSVVTLKCAACGAEVVINTDESLQARCHWCRNTLSTDTRIKNGAAPDAVIPFTMPREEAVDKIAEFASKRKFYANKTFLKEFNPENVIGVFLPYFMFDGNVTAKLNGVGEIETRRYTRRVNDKNKVFYDADVYNVARTFDMAIDDMFIEGSSDKSDMSNRSQTNNIINAILPFNGKEAVRYNPNYLSGHSSERRDRDTEHLEEKVEDMLLSTSMYKALDMIRQYDRGVEWKNESVTIHGSKWVSVYLPVWLYSYYDEDKDVKHFVAVNGQNGNVMGSVPINKPKLLLASAIVAAIGYIPAIWAAASIMP